MDGGPISARSEFDTFGTSAKELAERARRAASSHAIGMEGALAELVAPLQESIGIQLLKKMGWRQGR